MAEAADFERQRGQFGRRRAVFRRQRYGDLVEHGFVVADQLAFAPAFGGAGKNVQARAAQTAQSGKQAECGQHPRPVDALL